MIGEDRHYVFEVMLRRRQSTLIERQRKLSTGMVVQALVIPADTTDGELPGRHPVLVAGIGGASGRPLGLLSLVR